MGIKGHSISPFVATLSVFIIGLAVITYSLLSGAWYIFASICFFPFLLIMAIQALKNPFVGVCLLFTFMGHRTKRFFQWSGKMGERF